MKIIFECSPEECVNLMGLQANAVQQAMMKSLEEGLRAYVQENPDRIFKTMMDMGVQGAEQFQKMFFSNMQAFGSAPDKK